MNRVMYTVFFTLMVALSLSASELTEKSAILERKQLPEGIVKLTLKNGMRVWLKQTKYEKNEVEISLTALGGYSSLDPKERIAGNIAGKVARDSGLGRMDCNQFAEYLYSDSIEYELEILLNSRSITASSASKDFEQLLKTINLQFTQPCYCEEVFDKVVKKTKERIANHYYHPSFFDQTSSFIYPDVYKMISNEDFKNIDYQTSKRFFERSLSHPSEYVCVIVGDFELDDMITNVEKHLASISDKDKDSMLIKMFIPQFPTGIRSKTIKSPDNNGQALTRIVLPLNVDQSPQNEIDWHFVTRTVQNKLKSSFGPYSNVDISRSYPFYPSLKNPWFIIQFNSQKNDVQAGIKKIFTELNELIKNGISLGDLTMIKKTYEDQESYWMEENNFWVTVLKEYALSDWDPSFIKKQYRQAPDMTTNKFKKVVSDGLLLKNFTVITLIP